MRKVAVIPAVLLTVLCTLTGCKKEEVEKVIEPLVADIQTAETSQEAQEEEDRLFPKIDASVEIQPGAALRW